MAVLASPSSDVANLFSQKVNQSIKKSTSQSKMVVVYLCGGSGKPSRDVANLFGPKSQPVNQKSTSQSMPHRGGVLTAGKPYRPPEVGQ